MSDILEVFEYNQHFVAMMNIINKAKLCNVDEGKYEKHHIIPQCFYKLRKLKIDNSEKNLVKLTVEEHRKVHKLAVLCAKPFIRIKLKWASCMMNRETNPGFGYHQSAKGMKHSDEWKRKHSEDIKNKWKDPIFREKMTKLKLGNKNGFYGHKHSEESRRKMSEKLKGRIPWNKRKIEGEQ